MRELFSKFCNKENNVNMGTDQELSISWILSKTFYAGAHDLLGVVVTMSGGHELSASITFYT